MVVGGSYLWVVLWVANVANGSSTTSDRLLSQRRQASLLLKASAYSYFKAIDYLPPEPEERGPSEQRKTILLGVTALRELPSDLFQVAESETYHDEASSALLLVGNKRGKVGVLQFVVEEKDPDILVAKTTLISSLTHNADSKLPVFSLAVEREAANVFVGGGDRYVSVWEHQPTNGWKQFQRLGQHTGWVKAIAAVPSSASFFDCGPRVYSIGCNRVEVWERSSDEDGWRNFETVTIDSSPNAACTLSSDLLCLAHCRCYYLAAAAESPQQSIDILAAGGVDGRLHFFRNDVNDRMKPAAVAVSAHAGRVNALYFDVSTQFLFSVSHDAAIHCWSLEVEQIDTGKEEIAPSLTVSLVATHKMKDGSSRITALTCWRRQYDNPTQDNLTSEIIVAIGTNKGTVSLLSLLCAKRKIPNSCQFGELQNVEIANESDESGAVDPPVVTALCRLESCRVLVVGHSRGLGYIPIE